MSYYQGGGAGPGLSSANTTMYGLSLRARALCPQIGDKERLRFLVGTCSLREDNELHLLELEKNEDTGTDKCIGVQTYTHPNEIWDLAPNPTNPSLVFTTHSTPEHRDACTATLWHMKNNGKLIKLHNLEADKVKKVLWEPSATKQNTAVTIHENGMKVWDVEKGASVASADGWGSKVSKNADFGIFQSSGGCWSPHFVDEIATINNTSLRFWDLRSMKETFSLDFAHAQCVRSVDFNNNKPYYIATGGDDSQIKFWDYRQLKSSIKQFKGHSHWVWNVKYHTGLDQLVISSGTDGAVKLWNLNSISSNVSSLPQKSKRPPGGTARSAAGAARVETDEENLVKTYSDHEDSVYGLAWASATDVDTWTFASLSYDGRVVFSQVPQDEKYKILLCDTNEMGDSDDSDA